MMDENMLRMQREAVERVRQMQERARKYVENDGHFKEEKQQADQDKTLAEGLKPDLPENKLSAEKPGLIKKKPVVSRRTLGRQRAAFPFDAGGTSVRNDAPIELVLALLYIAM